METCTAKIYGLTGESNKEYYLSITLLAEKDHEAHALDMLDMQNWMVRAFRPIGAQVNSSVQHSF